MEKYDPQLPLWAKLYCFVHFVALVNAYFLLALNMTVRHIYETLLRYLKPNIRIRHCKLDLYKVVILNCKIPLTIEIGIILVWMRHVVFERPLRLYIGVFLQRACYIGRLKCVYILCFILVLLYQLNRYLSHFFKF